LSGADLDEVIGRPLGLEAVTVEQFAGWLHRRLASRLGSLPGAVVRARVWESPVAFGGYAGPVDAGSVDAGSVGAGSVGAGPAGAGSVDAGSVDAGPVDAGSVDAGSVDAGSVGAGSVGAGSVGAGSVDAGPGSGSA
jgi:hypothetical protein